MEESPTIPFRSDAYSEFSEDNHKDDISKTRVRYYMLIFACFLCFGNYFIYDNPSALQTQLEDVIYM